MIGREEIGGISERLGEGSWGRLIRGSGRILLLSSQLLKQQCRANANTGQANGSFVVALFCVFNGFLWSVQAARQLNQAADPCWKRPITDERGRSPKMSPGGETPISWPLFLLMAAVLVLTLGFKTELLSGAGSHLELIHELPL